MVLFLSIPAFCGPARKGPVSITQPDGTSFFARIRGDEFMKIITTEDGMAITQDEDGWWYYAYYDEEGIKTSSGYRVGKEVPAQTRSMSRDIPYDKISARAKTRRQSLKREEEPLMKRVMRANGVDTKASSGQITKHGLIILAQFKDVRFTYTRQNFIDMLTKQGYSSNGATGCAIEYFDSQFNGTVNFSFDISSIVTLSKKVSYYGGNDANDMDEYPHMMVIEACRQLQNEIDFSIYDDDRDGYVDNVFVFFAGGDEAEGAGEDRIWSHAWYIESGAGETLILNGKHIDSYACTAELSKRGTRDYLAGIGTFCHEYSHTFGLPDMYDTDYDLSGGVADALWGSLSLMDAGNQNNNSNTPPNYTAIEREILGLSAPIVISANGGYSLDPIHKNGKTYRLDTDNEDEYYLLECRSKEGWDKYIGGQGMLVYHVDKSTRNAGYSESYEMSMNAADRWDIYNEVNCRPDRQCADLIEASPRAYDVMDVFFPATSVTSLSSEAMPYWSGTRNKNSITNIRKTDSGVTFNVLGFSDNPDVELPPAVVNFSKEEFADAAIIQFESDRIFEGEAVAELKNATEGNTWTTTISPYEPGKYAITLEGLKPGNQTYILNIYFTLNGLNGEAAKKSLITKKSPAVQWPYIYMGSINKNTDGSISSGTKLPLRAYNAGGAEEVRWTFNGKDITVEADGYYRVKESGTLTAHVIWDDGSEDIIMKEIKISK